MTSGRGARTIDLVRPSRRLLVGCLSYAGLVAALTLAWSSSLGSGGFRLSEALSFLLTLPVSLLTLPVTYVVLAVVINVTGAGDGPAWLVAAGYAGWFAILAVANMALLSWVARGLRRARAG
jgi:hypothetical protein